jgi:chromosome segregation ATPase
LKRAEEKLIEANERAEAATERADKNESAVTDKEREKQTVQGELDDLLMVFGDLEDKVTKYKNRLKEVGGNVTDEDEDVDDDEEEEDDID